MRLDLRSTGSKDGMGTCVKATNELGALMIGAFVAKKVMGGRVMGGSKCAIKKDY